MGEENHVSCPKLLEGRAGYTCKTMLIDNSSDKNLVRSLKFYKTFLPLSYKTNKKCCYEGLRAQS